MTPISTISGQLTFLLQGSAGVPCIAVHLLPPSLAPHAGLHGTAESLLTVTNLLIVLGLRQGIREAEAKTKQQADAAEAEAVVGAGAAEDSRAN